MSVAAAAKRPYLFSPALDFLAAGGGSLLALLLLIAFFPYDESSPEAVQRVGTLAGVLYLTSFAINNPHFMASYQLFYRKLGARLANFRGHRELWWRAVNAAFVVPVALAGLLAYAAQLAMRGDTSGVVYALHAMFFFLGWHYVKQAFGVFITLSALKKIFYTPWQRRLLLINAYTVWLAAWSYLAYTRKYLGVAFQQNFIGVGYQRYGYAPMEMPPALQIVLLTLAVASTLGAGYAICAQWRATRVRPSVTALTGYTSMYYLWAFMALLHPEWALLTPLFHSLQYLLFVGAYKRGERREDHATRRQLVEFFIMSILLGILIFSFIPSLVDQAAAARQPGAVPTGVFVLLFAIFVNIHHYFIDNVIWRKENKEIGLYLFGRA